MARTLPKPALAAGPGRLIERQRELDLCAAAVAGARTHGALLVFEASSGMGKSRLLAETCRTAEAMGASTLRGRGGELEVDFPFGVAGELLEPRLIAVDPLERAELLVAAGAAAPLLTAADPMRTGRGTPMGAALHGLGRLVRRLAGQQTVLIAVDDLQWVDRQSLELLVYLSQRLENLPVVIVATRTRGEGGPHVNVADRLGSGPFAQVERLVPLSEGGVRALAEAEGFAGVGAGFTSALIEATRGVPFLVKALLASARAAGLGADAGPGQLAGIGSEVVGRATALRLARLSDDARAVAYATAVLGRDATLSRSAGVAGIDRRAAIDAADALGRAELLHDGLTGLRFHHELVRVSLYNSLPAGVRTGMHVEAARSLAADGADPQRTAEHLLRAQGLGEPWALQALRGAGSSAVTAGRVEQGISYLRRALDEDPDTQERSELLAELGEAEAAIGDPAGAARLALALERAGSGAAAARTLERVGGALWLLGQDARAAKAFERGLDQADDSGEPFRTARLRAGLLMAARFDSDLRERALPRLASTLREPGLGRPREPALLASIAFERALSGRRSVRVADLAERALEGVLADLAAVPSPECYAACCALLWSDSLSTAEIALTMTLEAARRRGHASAAATSSRFRAWTVLQRGRLAHAAADALEASGAEGETPSAAIPSAATILAEIDMEQGRFAEAALLLDDPAHQTSWDDGPKHAFHLAARGRLHHLRGHHELAVEDLLESGRRLDTLGVHNPAVLPWRSRAALAAASAGDRPRAMTLATDELALARTFGAPRPLGVALRAAALVGPAEDRLAILREALSSLERSPGALDRARALIDLGAELRRAGRRRESRECLRAGVDLAQRCEASRLQARGREELIAAGARPRRERLSGSEALTPRERQVAELAARGVRNRDIAERLFITAKTVEWHLGNAYRKLELHSRASLIGALGSPESAPARAGGPPQRAPGALAEPSS